MPSEYTLDIAGVLYPWTSIRYVRDYKFYGKEIEVITPEWVAAIAGNDAITIKREGTAVTSGKLKKIIPFEGVDKGLGMRLIGYTLEQKHVTMQAYVRRYLEDPADILKDDLGNTDLTEGTIDDYSSTIAMEFGASEEAKFNRKQMCGELAFVTGMELYVSPLGALDHKTACGTDRSASVIFKHPELIEKWVKPHTLNYLVKKTKVIVNGALEGKFLMYGVGGSGTDILTLSRKNLIDFDTCEKAAASVYVDAQNTLITGVFDVIDTYSAAAFDVYDTIHVEDSRFGVDDDYRIYRIERGVSAKGGEQTRIFYTNVTRLTGNGPILLELEDDILIEGQHVLRDVGSARFDILDFTHRHKYQGEHEAGYTVQEVAGGVVTVKKDYLKLETGVGEGQAIINSNDTIIDFSKSTIFDARFMINDLADAAEDRRLWLGFWNAGTSHGYYLLILGFHLYAVSSDGAADPGDKEVTELLNPVVADTWYRVFAVMRGGSIYFYFDELLAATHTSKIPSGVASTLYAQALAAANANNRNYTAYIDNYEVYVKYE